MNTLYIILAIVIIIVIVLILIYNNNSKSIKHETNLTTPIPSMISMGPYTPKTPLFDTTTKKGRLFSACPCQDGLVCNRGICRKPLESYCLVNGECASNHCILGKCVDRPPNNENNIHSVCLYNQLMKLNETNNKFELTWVNYMGVLNVLKIYNEKELYYIITEHGLYISNGNKVRIEISLKQLFYYQYKLYGVDIDGCLHQIDIDNEITTPLHTFLTHDFKHTEIVEVFANNASSEISFKVKYIHNQTEIISYVNNTWLHFPNLRAIIYVDAWRNRVEISETEINFYYNDNIIDKLELDHKYDNIVYNKNGLYLSTFSTIYHYKPLSKLVYPTNIAEISNIKLLNTDTTVWLVLDTMCFEHK